MIDTGQVEELIGVGTIDTLTSITNNVNVDKTSIEVILQASTTETSSFQTSGIDVSKYNEAYVHIDITAFDRTTGNELMKLDIEVSHDNITWVHRQTVVEEETVGDVTTLTGDADRGKIKAAGDLIAFIHGGLGKYMRLNGTLSGTTPSITYSAIGTFRG